MAMHKNKLLFTAFLIFASSSICANCGYIRNSEKSVPSERFPTPAVHPRGLFNSPSAETRHVVAETYHQNGRFQSLHGGSPFPISVYTDIVRGGFIKVTLNAVNRIDYEITYNNADGWVSNVRPIGQTQHTGTPDHMAAEAKLKNIIANCQQIAFEKDGRIQFITDNGSTRVSFDRHSGSSFNGFQSHSSFPASTLYPANSGYGFNGYQSHTPFPASTPFPANSGYGFNGYQSHTPFPASTQFPAYSGYGSNTFTGVQSRRVVPETYHQNGRFQALHGGSPFPIAVDTHVVHGGFIKVTLKAVNTIDYEITYNNADGWVSNVRPIGQSQHTGTPDQMAAEAKLKNIIANTQQIAFEKDGRIQFITDNGSTRVTFM